MKRFSEQFKKQSESIRLTTSERADLRDRVVAYMEYHPLPSSMHTQKKSSVRKTAHSIASQPFIAMPINWFYIRGAASAFAIFMAITLPVAAEYTAPGDVLYPVKVRFNEEVRSTLTLNQYDKIEWETKRLERRISEARLLATEGKLTDEVEASVAEAVKTHSETAKAQIAELRETDSDGAAIAEIAFATALSVQSEVLDKAIAAAEHNEPAALASGDTVEPAQGSVLASVVANETTEAAASQAASTPSFEKIMARVEVETTAAFELFDSVKLHASADQVADIERRLADIERKVVAVATPSTDDLASAAAAMAGDEAAVQLLSVEDIALSETASGTDVLPVEVVPPTPVVVTEAEAIEVLSGVMADLRKLISFMTDLDVSSAVSVEELVPITLTPEERTVAVEAKLQSLMGFEASYSTTTFSGIHAEKLTSEYVEIVRLTEAVQSAMALAQLEVAESEAASAIALMADMEQLLQQNQGVLTELEFPNDTPTTTTE